MIGLLSVHSDDSPNECQMKSLRRMNMFFKAILKFCTANRLFSIKLTIFQFLFCFPFLIVFEFLFQCCCYVSAKQLIHTFNFICNQVNCFQFVIDTVIANRRQLLNNICYYTHNVNCMWLLYL